MGLGLFFFSLGARLISAAEVAIIAQLENVLGPLWVWLAGIEHPSAATIGGGVLVIAAVAYQVTGSARPDPLGPARDDLPVAAWPGCKRFYPAITRNAMKSSFSASPDN